MGEGQRDRKNEQIQTETREKLTARDRKTEITVKNRLRQKDTDRQRERQRERERENLSERERIKGILSITRTWDRPFFYSARLTDCWQLTKTPGLWLQDSMGQLTHTQTHTHTHTHRLKTHQAKDTSG